MANRAAQIRQAIQEQYPGAFVVERTGRAIKLRLPDTPDGKRRYAITSTVGLLHLDDTTEIDTTITDSPDPDFDDEAGAALPYRVKIKNGNRRVWPRRDVPDEYIDLGRPEFQRPNGTFAIIPWDSRERLDDTIIFRRNDAELHVTVGAERLKMDLVLLSQPQRTTWRFPVSLTGLSRQGTEIISDNDGSVVMHVAPFTMVDATGVTSQVAGNVVQLPETHTYNHAYQISPNLTNASYPVRIDPTLDIAIAASADDATQATSGVVTTTGSFVGHNFDAVSEWAGLRFAVPLDSNVHIDAAHLRLAIAGTSLDEPDITIYAEAIDDAPAFTTSASSISSRSRTTASVLWSVPELGTTALGDIRATADLSPLLEEVLSRPGWASGQHVVFLMQGSSTAARDLEFYLWDDATNPAPVLYIEYVEPGDSLPLVDQAISNIGNNVTSLDLNLTPNANDLVLVHAVIRGTVNITNISGCGLTWTQEARVIDDQNIHNAYVFSAQAGSSPSAGPITLTLSGAQNIAAQAITLIGVDQTDAIEVVTTNQQGATDSATPSVDIGVLTANSKVMGFLSHRVETTNLTVLGLGETAILTNIHTGNGGTSGAGVAAHSMFSNAFTVGTTTISATLNAAREWTAIALAVKPAGTVVPPTEKEATDTQAITATDTATVEELIVGTVPPVADIRNMTFETGNLVDADAFTALATINTGMSITSTNALRGNYAVDVDGSTTGVYGRVHGLNNATIFGYLYVNFRAHQSGEVRLVQFSTALGTSFEIFVTSEGRIRIAALSGDTTEVLNLNTTYRIGFEYNSITGVHRVYLAEGDEAFGSPVRELTGLTLDAIEEIRFGATNTQIFNGVFDAIHLDTTTMPEPYGTGTSTTEIDVVDTQQLTQTETVVEITRSTTATDTEQIAQTETVITNTRLNTITDTESLAQTETVITNTRSNTITDTQSLTQTETVITNARTQSIVDTEQIAQTETVITNTRTTTITETDNVSIIEEINNVYAAIVTDTEDIVSSETAVTSFAFSATETDSTVAATETVITQTIDALATDTQTTASTETVVSKAVSSLQTDEESIAITEAAVVNIIFDISVDTESIAVVETASIIQTNAMNVDDSSSLDITESIAISAGRLADDTTVINDLNIPSIHTSHERTEIDAIFGTDAVLDNSAIYVGNDDYGVATTENTTSTTALSQQDELGVLEDTQVSIDAYAYKVDTTNVSIQETASLEYTLRVIAANDTDSVATTESALAELSVGTDQNMTTADQYRITIVETVGDRSVSYRPEIRDVDSIETATVLILHNRLDVTQPLLSSDAFTGPYIQTEDAVITAVQDVVNVFRNIELVDSFVFSGEDDIDLDIIYKENMTLFRRLRQQTEHVGFSRIGRGW